ncbi:hypothetical protein GCM10009608_78740 [Pseudonocardia alaniniphila]
MIPTITEAACAISDRFTEKHARSFAGWRERQVMIDSAAQGRPAALARPRAREAIARAHRGRERPDAPRPTATDWRRLWGALSAISRRRSGAAVRMTGAGLVRRGHPILERRDPGRTPANTL